MFDELKGDSAGSYRWLNAGVWQQCQTPESALVSILDPCTNEIAFHVQSCSAADVDSALTVCWGRYIVYLPRGRGQARKELVVAVAFSFSFA